MKKEYILKTYRHNAENLRRGALKRVTVGWVGPEQVPPVYLNYSAQWVPDREAAKTFTYEVAHMMADVLNDVRARDEKEVPSGLCIVEKEE
jgi:hypothetical protein